MAKYKARKCSTLMVTNFLIMGTWIFTIGNLDPSSECQVAVLKTWPVGQSKQLSLQAKLCVWTA